MKKLLVLLGIGSLLAGFMWVKLVNEKPAPTGYEKLFLEHLSQMHVKRKLTKHEGYTHADQFHAFDNLQRMNPETGEVPPFGLIRAYEKVKEMQSQRDGTSEAITWEERGPSNIGGRTRAIMFDPNDPDSKAVFAGGVGGGLWKLEDITSASSEWVNVNPMFSNVAVTAVAADPSNPQVMYFGTGEGYPNADALRGAGLWKSVDGGQTWENLAATRNNEFFFTQKILVYDNGDVYVASKLGLKKSVDGGDSFYTVLGGAVGLGGNSIDDLEQSADGSLFASSGGSGVYKSDISNGADLGEAGAWQLLNTNFDNGFGRIEIATAPSDANFIYALVENSGGVDKVYRSENGGASWAPTGSKPGGTDFSNGQAWYDLCIAVDPNDEKRLVVGAIDVYLSGNKGDNWLQRTAAYGGSGVYMHPDQHNLVFRPGSSTDLLVGNDGGVHYSQNTLGTVSIRNNGYNVTQFYSMAISGKPDNLIIGGTQDNGTIRVTNAGIDPGAHIRGGDGSYCAVNAFYPDTMFATSQFNSIGRSKNGGANFQNITNPYINDGQTLFINPIEIDPLHPEYLYQSSNALWRLASASSVSLTGWKQATAVLSSGITAISISEDIPYLAYIATGATVYRIPNVHQTDDATNPPKVGPGGAGTGYIHCIAINPDDGNHIIITYSNYGVVAQVYECKNANLGVNATWRSLQGNLPDLPVNFAAFEPNNPNGIIIGTDLGVFRAADITQATEDIYWSPERTGLGYPRVEMIRTRKVDNSAHLATHGRGFFSTYSYNQPPISNFGTLSDSACGGIMQFIDSSKNVPSGWTWDFGDGQFSNQQSPKHEYAVNGLYTIKLISSNPNGIDSIVKQVNVIIVPAAIAKAIEDTTVCENDKLYLAATGGVKYNWLPSGALEEPTSAVTLAQVPGDMQFIVTVTSEYGCKAKDTVNITTLPPPDIWAGLDETLQNIGDSVQLQAYGGVTYEWSPDSSLSCSDCPNPWAKPDSSTDYMVIGYTEEGCSAEDMVFVDVLMGVFTKSPSAIEAEMIFANPANKNSNLILELGFNTDIHLNLIDLQGKNIQRIHRGKMQKGMHTLPLDFQTVPSGIYFLRLRTDRGILSNKIVII